MKHASAVLLATSFALQWSSVGFGQQIIVEPDEVIDRPRAAQNQRPDFFVHTLLVIDSAADKEKTHGLEKAGERMVRLLNTLPPQDKARLRVTVLANEDASPERIRRYFSQLDSGPLDVVFFTIWAMAES